MISNLKEVSKPCLMDIYPQHEYVNLEFIEPLYIVFEIQSLNSLSLQDLFNLMQQMAEEENLLSLKYEQLDDFVPIVVVEFFISFFLKGYNNLYQEMGLASYTLND